MDGCDTSHTNCHGLQLSAAGSVCLLHRCPQPAGIALIQRLSVILDRFFSQLDTRARIQLSFHTAPCVPPRSRFNKCSAFTCFLNATDGMPLL